MSDTSDDMEAYAGLLDDDQDELDYIEELENRVQRLEKVVRTLTAKVKTLEGILNADNR